MKFLTLSKGTPKITEVITDVGKPVSTCPKVIQELPKCSDKLARCIDRRAVRL